MSETTTATVETLTAEVRTLMVNSRQVTLSVAKQLDEVSLHHLEVMGRVNLVGVRKGWESGGFVIGRDRRTGSLALARWEYSPNYRPEEHRAAQSAPLIVLAGLR